MKIQQFHESVKSAWAQIRKWQRDYRSSFSRDYGDYVVTKIRLVKGHPRTATGRRLYDIYMRKKKATKKRVRTNGN